MACGPCLIYSSCEQGKLCAGRIKSLLRVADGQASCLLGSLRGCRIRVGVGDRHQGRRTPTASLGQSSRRVKDQARRPSRHCLGASLSWRCGQPVGVGFFAVLPMASPASSLSRSALKARDALVLEHLPLADAIATATARRLFPLVEREDLIQVAREALVRSAPRCREGEPAGPYLRRCISGALQNHLRVRDESILPNLLDLNLDLVELETEGQAIVGRFGPNTRTSLQPFAPAVANKRTVASRHGLLCRLLLSLSNV